MKEFTEVRDNLYFADYIMSMLSYDTYELEGKYSLLRKGYEKEDIYTVDGGEITPQKAPSMYATQETNWKNDQTTFTHNKTLTNQMITIENNFSYGNETEYILYGNKIAENKLASYATIYSLRYAVNIAPVFGEYWSDWRVVTPIARAISLATSGVIPIPLVKLIICLGITAAETAVDVTYIKAGLPVLFIKTKDDLFLLLSGSEDGITGFSKNDKKKQTEKRPCFSYSDYLYLFLLIGTVANPDSIYLRTADVIQCNMQKLPDNIDFKMSKSIVYFQLDADVKVSPLMLGTPFSRQEGADILDTSSWNSFSYHGVRGY